MTIIKNTLLSFILFNFFVACNEGADEVLQYIDENKPGLTPMIFAPHFISSDSTTVFGSVFNAKGTEFFYAEDTSGKSIIKYTTIVNGKWIKPESIISEADYNFNDPFLSPDESALYYISDRPIDSMDTINDFNIWYSTKNNNKWSEPINVGDKINTDGNEFYISFTRDGSMYFASNKENYEKRKHDCDIYKSQFSEGEFLNPQILGDSINTGRYEADVFIAPDESYIIFTSARRSGFGSGDLYISFKNENGQWSGAVNMGAEINTDGYELCPFVTSDGKYLFYTSNQNIYWVSTGIFKSFRENNKSSDLK